MSTALATQNGGALALAENELIDVLTSSLYPGASVPSVKMVLGYCKAAGLDPMQKPVHIVPMKVDSGRKDDRGWAIKENRDVIMPGVGLYRTQASRTGQYIGMSEPTFGPALTLEYQATHWEDGPNERRVKKQIAAKVTYPEWCSVTVRRMVAGHVCEFTAVEYWLENYATKGADSEEPNAMWKKRPYGQIAKCAEAQALRKAFPEVGSAPTAEEMEGKELLGEHPQSGNVATSTQNKPIPAYPAEGFAKNLPTWQGLIEDGKKTADQIIATVSTKGLLSEEQIATLRAIQPVIDVTDAVAKEPAQAEEQAA